MFLNLIKEPLPGILAQIEIIPKLLYNLIGIIIFEDFYLFDMFPVQFYFEDAYRFLNHRQKAVHGPPAAHGWRRQLHWSRLLFGHWLGLRLWLLWLRNLVSAVAHRQVQLWSCLLGSLA